MPCTECDSRACVSNGERWRCLSCGETYPVLTSGGRDEPEEVGRSC